MKPSPEMSQQQFSSSQTDWKTRFYQQLEENKKLVSLFKTNRRRLQEKSNQQIQRDVMMLSGKLYDREREIVKLKSLIELMRKECRCEA